MLLASVVNTSAATLSLWPQRILNDTTGSFAEVDQFSGVLRGAGESLAPIAFQPIVAGAVSASLVIPSDGTSPEVRIALTGVGVEADAGLASGR